MAASAPVSVRTPFAASPVASAAVTAARSAASSEASPMAVSNPATPRGTSTAPKPSGVADASSASDRPMDSVLPSAEKDGRAASATPWVASTYFAEGLPYSLVHQVSAQFFTAMGASLSAIGLTSLYGLAWNLKFAWAPLVDRFGTARRWLIGLQVALAVVVALIAWPASVADLSAVARLLVLVSLLAATHDIAIDGFYLRALGKNDQAALSGLRVAAYRLALLAGNGLIVAVAGLVGWFTAFALAGGMLGGLALLHAWLLPRPQKGDLHKARPPAGDDRTVAASPSDAGSTWMLAYTSFFKQPAIALILLFILFFRAGDAMMFAMSTPLLKDLGLDTAMRGYVAGIGGTTASIAGAVIGGAYIARHGLRRNLFRIALAQSVAIPLYVLLAAWRPGLFWISAIVVTEQFIAGIGTAAFVVFLMRRCSGDYKASHFAIATALMSVAATLAGSASGFVADAVGFVAFFAIAFVASLPGVVLSRWMPVED